MGTLTPFAFEDVLVRVQQDKDGTPWFVAKDVCRVLDLGNVSHAVSKLDDDEKGITNRDTLGGEQQVLTISESGLYALIFRSRKPEARRFRKWVTAEVLPALRKQGHYTLSHMEEASGHAPVVPGSNLLSEEVLRLRPTVRQRLWQDAMQAARLDNAGSDAAQEWFHVLCKLMVAERPRTDLWRMTEDFMDSCLRSEKGASTSARDIYAAYQAWWRANVSDNVPSRVALSKVLLTRYPSYKSGSMRYRDCLLVNEPQKWARTAAE